MELILRVLEVKRAVANQGYLKSKALGDREEEIYYDGRRSALTEMISIVTKLYKHERRHQKKNVMA